MWARLEAGARVADVGCGAGVALVAMATAFPNSSFEGFDPSRLAVDLARARISDTGLANVTLHLGPATDLPARPTYDLVLTLDCIHDMPNPAEAMVAIRRAIRPDGTWLIKDISRRCDLERQPAQPDAGHDVRDVRRGLPVFGAFRAGRGRARHARVPSPVGRGHVPGSRFHPLRGPRL